MRIRSRLFATLGVFSFALLLAQRDIKVARQVRLFNGWGLSPAGEGGPTRENLRNVADKDE